jgi:putative spermidine/putrescine transport system substrate-binding protein
MGVFTLAGCATAGDTSTPNETGTDTTEMTEEAVSYEGQELVVSSFGGDWEKALIAGVVIPFEAATGAKVKLVTAYSADALAQVEASRDNPQFDVVHFSGGQEVTAAELGLLEPITADELATYADLQEFAVAGLESGQGPVIQVTPVGLVFRTDLGLTAPTSWADIFEEEYAGAVALTDFSNTYGVLSMLRINDALGGTIDDPTAGIDAIGELAASGDAIVVATSAELQTAFVERDIALAPYAQDYAQTLIAAGIPVEFITPEEGLTASFITASAVAGSGQEELSKLFIDYTLRPEAQATFATLMRYASVNKTTQIPAVVQDSVLSPSEVGNVLRYDPIVISDNRPAWTERWNNLIVK